MSKTLVRVRRAGLLALLAASACSTNDVGAGPTVGPRFAIRPSYPPLFAQFANQLSVQQVIISLIRQRTDAPVAADTVQFSPDVDSLAVPLSFQLQQAVETLFVSLDYRTALGQSLFSGGSTLVVAAGLLPTASPPVPVSYVGPGANTAALQLTPRDTVVPGGTSVPLSATGVDANGAPVAGGVYVNWSTNDPTVPVNADGVVRTPIRSGQVMVYARTPNGVSDSTTVSFTLSGASAGALTGRVVDAVTQLGIPGVTVDFFDQANAKVASVVTTATGAYTTPTLPAGTYSASATIAGYVTVQLFDAQPAGTAQPTTLPSIPMVPAVVGAAGSVSGTVRDARTNLGIAGATVELRSGVSNISGTLVQSTVADTGGFFSFPGLALGTYTLVSKAAGYVNGSRTGVAVGGQSLGPQDILVSPTGANEIRMVLTWGANPSDLDSHLTGPDPSNPTPGSRFHVYFSNPGSLTGPPYANLDYDVTTGFGPETITITQQAAGVYRYSVHDYTDAGDTLSTALSASGARVDLYIKGALVQQFFVPVNKVGTLWTVFELDGQTVTPVNLMSNEASSDAVTTAPYSSIGGTDAGVIGAAVQAHPKP